MAITRTVAGRAFTFDRADVEDAVRESPPEPLHRHYVDWLTRHGERGASLFQVPNDAAEADAGRVR